MPPARHRTRWALVLVAGVLLLTSMAPFGASAGTPTTVDATARMSVSDAAVLASVPAKDAHTLSPLSRHAIRWVQAHTHWETRTCLWFVRLALHVPRKYATAMIAWRNARYRHHTSIYSIPAGVPVFSRGKSASGHVAISLGHGWVRSTDWPRAGRVGTVRLKTLLATWRDHYVGWSEDLNGVRVWHR